MDAQPWAGHAHRQAPRQPAAGASPAGEGAGHRAGPAAPGAAVTLPPPHRPPSRGQDRTIPSQRLGPGQGLAPSHLRELTEPQNANRLPGHDPTEEHPRGPQTEQSPGTGALKPCLRWRNHGCACVIMVVTRCGVGSSPPTGPRDSPQGPGCKGGTKAEGWGQRQGWGCMAWTPADPAPPPSSSSLPRSQALSRTAQSPNFFFLLIF